MILLCVGFPGGSDSKESACSAGEPSSVPGVGSSPGGGHGHPLQCSCLEKPMDRGAWRAAAHGVAQSDTPEHTCPRSAVCTGCLGSLSDLHTEFIRRYLT